jgi:hypothetical protein
MNPAETNVLLRTLIEEVRGLRADLAGKRTAPKAVDLQEVLDAIAFAVGNASFTAKDLARHAEVLPPERLKNVLQDAGGTSHKCIGKLLRDMSRREFTDWRITQVKRESDGMLWIIEPVTLRM